jgi:hypothetical protein
VHLLQLLAYLLWIAGAFLLVAATIMLVVGVRLLHRGRLAGSMPTNGCGHIRPGAGPVRVSGVSAPGQWGMLRAQLSGAECVWYRERVLRFYVTRVRRATGTDGGAAFELVPQRAEQPIWEWHSGPFAIQDGTGGVLVAPELLASSTIAPYRSRDEVLRNLPDLAHQGGPEQFLGRTAGRLGYPVETAADMAREGTDGTWPPGPDPLAALVADGLLPAAVVATADADAATTGYRVVEEIVRPGQPFSVFAGPANLDGQAILAIAVASVPAISGGPLPAVLGRGGWRGAVAGIVLGLAGMGCLVGGGLLLRAAGMLG